jgi:hypothetical protein
MNFLQYLQLLELATPLAIKVTAAVQSSIGDAPGTAKLQYVLNTVQQGLQVVSGITATADQLTPIVNAAVALHKASATAGFTTAAAPAVAA